MGDTLRTDLVVEALNMAVWNRRPTAGVVHHSDRGAQCTSLTFSRRCQEAGVAPSMGSVGDAYDNALAEAFFATLEAELLMRHTFAMRKTARLALFDYIEGFYDSHRRHSALGYLSRRSSSGDGGGAKSRPRTRSEGNGQRSRGLGSLRIDFTRPGRHPGTHLRADDARAASGEKDKNHKGGGENSLILQGLTLHQTGANSLFLSTISRG